MIELTPVEQLNEAIRIAVEAHEGQVYGEKLPYIVHPLRVMTTILSYTQDLELGAAAVLHDVVEDSDITITDLIEKGFSIRVIKAVEGVTKKRALGINSNETYDQFIHRAAKEKDSRTLKIADLNDNLSHDPEAKLRARYQRALNVLLAADILANNQ